MSHMTKADLARTLPEWLHIRQTLSDIRDCLTKMEAASLATVSDLLEAPVNRFSEATCSLSRLNDTRQDTEDLEATIGACKNTITESMRFGMGQRGAEEAVEECKAKLTALNRALTNKWPLTSRNELDIMSQARTSSKFAVQKLNNKELQSLMDDSFKSLDEALRDEDIEVRKYAMIGLLGNRAANSLLGESLLDRMTIMKSALANARGEYGSDENWVIASNCVDALEDLARDYSTRAHDLIEFSLMFKPLVEETTVWYRGIYE